jgi:serine/threonine protein kinase
LLRRGISAAQPVAWFEKEADASLTNNYYLCEYVQAEWTARDMIGAFAAGETSFYGVEENTAYSQLASYLGRMHGGGVLFRDLSGGNIMISRGGNGELAFSLIDTGRIRVFPGPLSLRQRLADLVRICNKMHRDGRAKFLEVYLAALGKRPRWWHRGAFVAYDFKVAAKRRFGRKAWRRLLAGKRGA